VHNPVTGSGSSTNRSPIATRFTAPRHRRQMYCIHARNLGGSRDDQLQGGRRLSGVGEVAPREPALGWDTVANLLPREDDPVKGGIFGMTLPRRVGPEALSEGRNSAVATSYPQQTQIGIEIEQFDGFVRPDKRIRRFPVVIQADATEAGAASLAMMCRYYGRKVSTTRVRDAVHTAVDGTSLVGIRQGA
jgi:hypothetical protein